MKKFIVVLMLVTFTAAVAFAANTGKESVTYDGGKKGVVTFPHRAHQANFDCAKCHEGTPAKIAIDGKKQAHAFCKNCHKANKGPTKCGTCHKK